MPEGQTPEQQTQTQTQSQVPADKGGKPDTTQQTQNTQQVVKPDPAPDKRGVDDANRGLVADLQKERQARQQLQQQVQQFQQQLEAEKRRVMALAGVNPQTAEETELEEVRAKLVKIFPVLGKLTDKQVDNLLQLGERAGGIEEATQHHWQNHGRQMLSQVQDAVAEAVGSDLTERQVKALNRAYVAEAESNPEFLARHEAGDKTLIEEFAKQWIEDWFEPARRRVVTDEVTRRRPVPRGGDRTVQTTPAKKIDFKDEKAVSDAMVESFKSHGGRFES